MVYADDLLIAGEATGDVEDGKRAITTEFAARDMGEPTLFLGPRVERNLVRRTLWLGQTQYVKKVLERFSLGSANPTLLPMGTEVRLLKEEKPLDDEKVTRYLELVGSLRYLATCTRPDASFAVGRLSRFFSAPTAAHWAAGKRFLRYLAGTADRGLEYHAGGPTVGYCDADFAADLETRRSTTG